MPEQITADEALKKLIEGNQRWVQEIPHRPNQTVDHRLQVARNGQRPYAAVLGCSDSRVPAEIIFDVGLGDLFMIRTAGNVASDFDLGSIEYGVLELGIPLVMVLGHEKCGAITAAVSAQTAPGYIGHIVQAIQPAVTIAREQGGDLIAQAVRANIALVTQQIVSASTILRERIQEQKLTIIGGYYCLENGEVRIIDSKMQEKILAIE